MANLISAHCPPCKPGEEQKGVPNPQGNFLRMGFTTFDGGGKKV
jgi:hypothetical protein